MLFNKFIGLTIAALLNITTSFVSPAITWINNSSLNITIGNSVNYYFDIEYNEWYPSSGSVDTAGTGRCDTNIIIGNGTDPMTGFIQYDRTALTRGTNLISYDANVVVTSNMIYFYNVSSFTLTTFFSTDIGELNQPTFTITFLDGLIWDERDDSDIYNLVNSMQSNISSIKTYEQSIYGQVLQMALDLGYAQEDIDSMTSNIVSIDSKMDNIISYLSTINNNIINVNNTLKNYFLDESYHTGYIRALHIFNNKFSTKEDIYYDVVKIRGYSNYNNNNTSADFLVTNTDLTDNILVFLCSNDRPGNEPYLVQSGKTEEYTNYTRTKYINYSVPYLVAYRFTQNNLVSNRWLSLMFPNNNAKYYPVYWGTFKGLPDQIANELGIDKYAENTSELENARDDFVTQSNQLIEFENAQNENMQQQLQNINFNFDGSQFNESASFYKRVFTDFVGSTPLFTPLAVILTFCLAMILLGAL